MLLIFGKITKLLKPLICKFKTLIKLDKIIKKIINLDLYSSFENILIKTEKGKLNFLVLDQLQFGRLKLYLYKNLRLLNG